MDIDPNVAFKLGFPKTKYVAVERERRWLCRTIPRNRIHRSEWITDLYVKDARLRLRELQPVDGGPPMFKFSRKVDVDPFTRLITTIYLTKDEFAILTKALDGALVRKLRHRLHPSSGVSVSVDEFQDELGGLVMAEAEFETREKLEAFLMPDFALQDITDDARYSGGHLAWNGKPSDL